MTEQVIAGLILIVVTWLAATARERRRRRQQTHAALERYAHGLAQMIRAGTAKSNPEDVYVSARAIVSARDEMRGPLNQLRDLLNGDIGQLAYLLKQAGGAPPDQARAQEMLETMKVLDTRWPAKRPLIETELRKIVAELGLVDHESSFGRQPRQK